MDQTLDEQGAIPGGMVPVSVVIPCYRCHSTINTAVRSVLDQTARPAEIILVEDCSEDGGLTLGAIEAIARSDYSPVHIVVLRLPENRGPGEARNVGWEAASQKLVAFLDADDTWHPRKLAIQAGWMLANPDYALTCHDSVIREGRDSVPLPASLMTRRKISGARLLYRNEIATRTVMLRCAVAQRFPRNVRHAEDFQLWLRIVLRGGAAMRICLPLAYSYKEDFGAGGLSGNLRAMHQGVLHCLKAVREDRLISNWTFLLATAFETLKYWRRFVVTEVATRRRGG